ncbi:MULTISPECIES: hypothetical protein [unclassified Moorena]|uniref:hypothetical protein n=1 Tax=unclassified Moorena TaxID=2683338 RepID=UPI0013FF2AD9|nr:MULTISPECIES: hypothetical protein [unclassified Moorena]NEO16917.1 hypothetical protein [Moorena sp. SIO3E8]NEQ02402.1 hypothetical protein [Moorena sp. SIO3F7]
MRILVEWASVERASCPLQFPASVERASCPLQFPVSVERASCPLSIPGICGTGILPVINSRHLWNGHLARYQFPASVERASCPLQFPSGLSQPGKKRRKIRVSLLVVRYGATGYDV